MSNASKWEELSENILNQEAHELKELITMIIKLKENATKENILELEQKYEDSIEYLKTLPAKDYVNIEKLLKTQIGTIKDNMNRQLVSKLTKWEMFVEEAKKNDWQPIIKVIDVIEEAEKGEMTEEKIKLVEESINSIRKYIDNLSPYDSDSADKEFVKKLRIFRNKVSRVIEDDFGSWIRQLRKAKGYSLKDLESVTGVTASYIHRIESGSRKTPSIPIAEKLAIGLGLNSEEFLKKLHLFDGKTEKKEMLTGFAETIILHSFTINGKKVTKGQKELLIDIYKEIIGCPWSEESKINDTMSLGNKVDKFKKSL